MAMIIAPCCAPGAALLPAAKLRRLMAHLFRYGLHKSGKPEGKTSTHSRDMNHFSLFLVPQVSRDIALLFSVVFFLPSCLASKKVTHPSAAARSLRGDEPAALHEALPALLEVLRLQKVVLQSIYGLNRFCLTQ